MSPIRSLFTFSFLCTLYVLFQMNVFTALLMVLLTVFFYRRCQNFQVKIPNWSDVLKFLGISLLLIPFYIILAKQFIIVRDATLEALLPFTRDTLYKPQFLTLLGLLFFTLPFVYLFHYWLVGKIVSFIKTLTRREWWCFAAGVLFFAGSLLILANQTSFWVFGINPEQFVGEFDGVMQFQNYSCDEFFDSDTGQGIFCHTGRDCSRHPIYRLHLLVTAVPSALLYCVNHLFFASGYYSLALGFAEMQCVFFVLGAILLNRILRRFLEPLTAFLIVLFYVCSFTGIWVFVPERIIPSVFWCIAAVYCWLNVKSSEWTQILVCLLATGACLLSWGLIVLLVLWTDGKDLLPKKPWRLKDFLKQPVCFWLVFLGLLAGHCLTIFPMDEGMWSRPAVSLAQFQKNSRQYLHFAESCVFLPQWQYETYNKLRCINSPVVSQVQEKYLSPTTLLLGAAVILGVVLSSVLWFREPFVQIAFLWFGTSVGVLLLMGFGSVLDTMVLYSPYFSWVILPLSCLWLTRLPFKNFPVSTFCLVFLTLFVVCTNVHFVSKVTSRMKETYVLIQPEQIEQAFCPKFFIIKYNLEELPDESTF